MAEEAIGAVVSDGIKWCALAEIDGRRRAARPWVKCSGRVDDVDGVASGGIRPDLWRSQRCAVRRHVDFESTLAVLLSAPLTGNVTGFDLVVDGGLMKTT